MARFPDLLSAVVSSGGAFPDTFANDATAAYDEDMAVLQGGIDGKDAEIARLTDENNRLKIEVYELTVSRASSPAGDAPTENTADPADEEDPDEDDDSTPEELYNQEDED